MATPHTPFAEAAKDYQRIERLLGWITVHTDQQPSLDTLARVAHLSPHHLQRIFTRWVGLSPKQFLAVLTTQHAKALLAESRSVLDTSLTVGLSGPGCLHDLFVKIEAMTPGEYKQRGLGLQIRYGAHPTPFGPAFIAITKYGICALSFLDDTQSADARAASLASQWPQATLLADSTAGARYLKQIFAHTPQRARTPIPVVVKGTQFQIKVWQALLNIPWGSLVSYQDVATFLHRTTACRAVANAIADNPVGIIIPCHRVIQKLGHFGGYRWGAARKQALIAWEQS